MKDNVTLVITSLLSILLMSFHHADDVARGMAPGGVENLIAVVILLVWLYGTLVLAERRSGHIIILVASIFTAGMPMVHMMGSGLAGGNSATPTELFFFAWTLIALSVTTLFSVILSARGLWGLRRRHSR